MNIFSILFQMKTPFIYLNSTYLACLTYFSIAISNSMITNLKLTSQNSIPEFPLFASTKYCEIKVNFCFSSQLVFTYMSLLSLNLHRIHTLPTVVEQSLLIYIKAPLFWDDMRWVPHLSCSYHTVWWKLKRDLINSKFYKSITNFHSMCKWALN